MPGLGTEIDRQYRAFVKENSNFFFYFNEIHGTLAINTQLYRRRRNDIVILDCEADFLAKFELNVTFDLFGSSDYSANKRADQEGRHTFHAPAGWSLRRGGAQRLNGAVSTLRGRQRLPLQLRHPRPQ